MKNKFETYSQCVQMARLFFIVCLLTTAQSCPILLKNSKVGSKFCQTLNKPLYIA